MNTTCWSLLRGEGGGGGWNDGAWGKRKDWHYHEEELPGWCPIWSQHEHAEPVTGGGNKLDQALVLLQATRFLLQNCKKFPIRSVNKFLKNVTHKDWECSYFKTFFSISICTLPFWWHLVALQLCVTNFKSCEFLWDCRKLRWYVLIRAFIT